MPSNFGGIGGMPPELYSSMGNAFGMDIAEAFNTYWPLLRMGCFIMGSLVVIHVLIRVYKSYKYNRQDFRDGALLKFFAGICLVNINEVIRIAVSYA